MNDLSKSALQQALGERPFRFFEAVDSTNDIALNWIQDGAVRGAVVIADEQLKGRGRKGRLWHTPPHVALAVSVVLKPPKTHLNRVSMLGALAVADLCEHVGLAQVGIKWPNDVQVSGKKVSGILPEAAWDGDVLHGVVLGMGINVRVQFEDGLADKAISIEPALGQPVQRVDLIAYLLERIDYWSAHITSDRLFTTWESRLNTIGQRVSTEGIVGQAQGVDESGALLIKTADGSIQRVLAGDVSLVMSSEESRGRWVSN